MIRVLNLVLETFIAHWFNAKRKLSSADQIRSELSLLTDLQLEERLKSCVSKELEMKIQILHLLGEVEKRRLYGLLIDPSH